MTFNDDALMGCRDVVAALCENRPLLREKQIATVISPSGRAKALANEVGLVTGMCYAAYEEDLSTIS